MALTELVRFYQTFMTHSQDEDAILWLRIVGTRLFKTHLFCMILGHKRSLERMIERFEDVDNITVSPD